MIGPAMQVGRERNYIMASNKYFLAIDIGASSGRHIVGWMENGELKTEEVHRFWNGMDNVDGSLVWDTDRLFAEVKTGIASAFAKYPHIESLSIDTWGVDYVLMRGDEEVKPTYAYRDSRTDASIPAVHAIIPFETLYERTGIMFNKFNSIYQLYRDKMDGRLEGVTSWLMIPEYLMYKLTGKQVKEFTNATTAGLINAETLSFDKYIFDRLGLPECLMSEVHQPGTLVGRLKPEIAAEVGGDLDVVLCATHDTGSAVEAIEMQTDAPYISSGTWSLLGVKTERAITDEKSRLSGYSNEGGVGYNRYQKNITGMWIIQSLRRELAPDMKWDDLMQLAIDSPYKYTFDVNDDAFMAPESMSAAISDYLVKKGCPAPDGIGDILSSAYVSLAEGYREAIADLESNTGKKYSEIYIVGGGARQLYVNELTESFTGKRVVALPIEATAIGNMMVQIKRAQ